MTDSEDISLIPEVDNLFVKNNTFTFLNKVIKSGVFYPVYITGDSGNGKTMTVRQVCAASKRECIRVNFNIETDETLLIGGYTLKNGDTVFQEGPVITAMKRGAILLLDEIDASHPNKVLCLQSVIDGQGVLIKETGEFVTPKDGFTVIATANTKGKGSESGRFIGANMQNSALIDRFPAMIEQEYPTKDQEKKILIANIDRLYGEREVSDQLLTYQTKLIESLTEWSDSIRQAYKKEVIEEVITTRTLVNIVKGWFITDDIDYSVKLACSRYDEHVKRAMIEFWDLSNKLEDIADVNEGTVTVKTEKLRSDGVYQKSPKKGAIHMDFDKIHQFT